MVNYKGMADSLTSGSGLKGGGQLFDTPHCCRCSHKPGNPASLLAHFRPHSVL